MVFLFFRGKLYLNFWISSNNYVSILFRHLLKIGNEGKGWKTHEDKVDSYLCQAGNVKNM